MILTDLDPVIDLFAGPGGWEIAARTLGIQAAGFELDAIACDTRRRVGLTTVQCDVSRMAAPSRLRGLTGSPPCVIYSRAGWQLASYLGGRIAALIRDRFAGRDDDGTDAIVEVLTDACWMPQPVMTTSALTEARRHAAVSAALVTEPARFIRAGTPRWIALEQVPPVQPLWDIYAQQMRDRRYSVWTGILNAADYGLGQIRRRAVLIASLDRAVSCPPPTHYDPARGRQLFGQPWRSMADVLGWGCTHRPSPTVTAGGIKSGGPEPFGHAARRGLATERDAGRWIPKSGVDALLQTVPRPTPEECARLQGFPDKYPFAGNTGLRGQQAGNAVPPPLARHILAMATGRRIIQEAA